MVERELLDRRNDAVSLLVIGGALVASAFATLVVSLSADVSLLVPAGVFGSLGVCAAAAGRALLKRRVTFSDRGLRLVGVFAERWIALDEIAGLRLRPDRRAGGWGLHPALLVRGKSGQTIAVMLREEDVIEAAADWTAAASAVFIARWTPELEQGRTVEVSARVKLSAAQLSVGARSIALDASCRLREDGSGTPMFAVLNVANGKQQLAVDGQDENYLPLRRALREILARHRGEAGDRVAG